MASKWQRVEAVAIKFGDAVETLPSPARHVDVRRVMRERGLDGDGGEEGFILSDGSFASRWNAGRHAVNSGQVAKLKYGKDLYSEDLW